MADADGNATAGGIAGRRGGHRALGACGRLEKACKRLVQVVKRQCRLSEDWAECEGEQECKCQSGSSARGVSEPHTDFCVHLSS